jgi:hypothetical protein
MVGHLFLKQLLNTTLKPLMIIDYLVDIVDETDIHISHDGDYDNGHVQHSDLVWLVNFFLQYLGYTNQAIIYEIFSKILSGQHPNVDLPSQYSDRDSHCKVQVENFEEGYYRLKFIFPRPDDGRKFYESL